MLLNKISFLFLGEINVFIETIMSFLKQVDYLVCASFSRSKSVFKLRKPNLVYDVCLDSGVQRRYLLESIRSLYDKLCDSSFILQ